MRPSTRLVVLSTANIPRWGPELFSGQGYSGGAYGHWNGMSRAGNVLTPNGGVFNGWSYRANVTPGKLYRVTSPQAASPTSGEWDISVSWSNNGTNLSGHLADFAISTTEFYFTAPATAVSVEVTIRRFFASGSSDSITFYGFSMVEVLPPANKTYSDNLLPANGSVSGGVFGHFNPITRSGNTLTANTTPANGFYYRSDVKPSTVYRVTSPQPAVPLTGSWHITIAFSNDGTSLVLPLNRYDINSTEFFFRTSSSTVKVDVVLERTSNGSTDSCLFYGFSMFEVL